MYNFQRINRGIKNSQMAVALHMILSPQTVYLSQHVVLWSVAMSYITSLLLCQCISLIECWAAVIAVGMFPVLDCTEGIAGIMSSHTLLGYTFPL